MRVAPPLVLLSVSATPLREGRVYYPASVRVDSLTMSQAYVTLATNDGYAIGALVLGHSLRSNNTTKDLCIMISPAVSSPIQSLLESVFSKVITVDVLDSEDSAHLSLLKRPELGVTFTKLHCWTLTNYSKCVFLDADMLCVQNPDDLFSHPELTAVCDIGWPDCFNSGMFVFVPSLDTYGKLLQHAETKGSFDGGDQGLLNTYFPNWNRVSFVYNMVASATYTYLPAYKQYGANAKLVHFLGSLKPWHHRYDASSGSVHTPPGYEHLASYLNSWWTIYLRLVRPEVPEMDLQSAVEEITPLEDVQEINSHFKVKEPEGHEHSSNHVYDGPEVKDKNLSYKVLGILEIHSECVSNVDVSNMDKYDNECENINLVAPKESGNTYMAAPTVCVVQEVVQQLAGMSIGQDLLPEGQARWERGEPDYLGQDSFANIQAYIDGKIQSSK